MRVCSRLSGLCLALLLALPTPAAARPDGCDALTLVVAVVTHAPEASMHSFQADSSFRRLTESASAALDRAEAARTLPASKIAAYRAVLSERTRHGGEAIGAHGLRFNADRQVIRDWRLACTVAGLSGPALGVLATDADGLAGAPSARGWTAAPPAQRGARSWSPRPTEPVASEAKRPLMVSAVVILIAGITMLSLRWADQKHKRKERQSHRIVCDLRGGLITAEGRYGVRVRDLSQLGCKVRTRAKVAPRQPCWVRLGGKWLSGRVVWSTRHYAGIEFAQPLQRDFVHAAVHGPEPVLPPLAIAKAAGVRARLPESRMDGG